MPSERPLVLKMSISIDGFVGGPLGEIDWIFGSMDAEAVSWIVETLSSAGVHIMGHRTYHDMAAFWPTSTLPFAAPMNEIPKVVFSRSGQVKAPSADLTTMALKDATAAGSSDDQTPVSSYDWHHPKCAGSDLVHDIEKLKDKPGGFILAHGGASFAQSLVASDLVDEYRLIVHPVALGQGLPLFSSLLSPLHLQLAEVKVFTAGTVAKRYLRVRRPA